jgi:hypothetical protein
MDTLLYAFQLMRPLWLSSAVLSLAACGGIVVIAWG